MLLPPAKPDDTFGRGGAITSQLCSKCDPAWGHRRLSLNRVHDQERGRSGKNVPARFGNVAALQACEQGISARHAFEEKDA